VSRPLNAVSCIRVASFVSLVKFDSSDVQFESIQLEVIFWNLLEGLKKVTPLIEIGVIIFTKHNKN